MRNDNVKVISTATAVSLLAKDSYQLALLSGFEGTLLEWLNSLRGRSGSDGLSAYQIAVKNGFSGSEKDWLWSLNACYDLEDKNFVEEYLLNRN